MRYRNTFEGFGRRRHGLGEALSGRADDGDAVVVQDPVAGAEDDDVGVDLAAVLRGDPGGAHGAQPFRDQLDVLPQQGRIEIVGDQTTLAPVGVGRCEGGPQLRVRDRIVDERAGSLLELLGPVVPQGGGVVDHAHQELLDPPDGLHDDRESAPPVALCVGVELAAPRHDPVRRPLQHGEFTGDLGHLGDDLHRTGGGADDHHPLAGQFDIVIPAGAVKACPLEFVDTGHIRIAGRVLIAHRIDDHVIVEPLAGSGLQPPEAVVLVVRAGDAGVQGDVRIQAELGGAPLQIGLDLGLIDEAGAPLGIGPVGERVGMGPDIAGQAGVGVQVPGAADRVGGFEDGEGVKAVGQ